MSVLHFVETRSTGSRGDGASRGTISRGRDRDVTGGAPCWWDGRSQGVELKLQRAEEHIAYLDAEIQSFLGSNPYGAYRTVEDEGLEHVIWWSRYAEPPARLGLIAGDAIHNLRSSLDHMVVALAQAGQPVQVCRW